jgi:hypothetical protein
VLVELSDSVVSVASVLLGFVEVMKGSLLVEASDEVSVVNEDVDESLETLELTSVVASNEVAIVSGELVVASEELLVDSAVEESFVDSSELD